MFKTHSYRGLLLSHVLLVNTMALGIGAVLWLQGLLSPVFTNDASGLTWVIAGLAMTAIAVAVRQASHVGSLLDDIEWRYPPFAVERREGALMPLRHTANVLVLLGLVGTVIGFIVALSSIEGADVSNPSEVGELTADLMTGMGIAFYTTLVGAVGHIWLSINIWLIEGGIATLRRRSL